AAVGRTGSILTAGLVRAALTDPDAAVRRTALDAAARHGLGELPALCREAARRFEPVVEALAFLGVVGEHDDVATLQASLRDRALVAATLEGLADLGTPEVVPSLLDTMEMPDVAESAADAFTQITGIDVPRVRVLQLAPRDEQPEAAPDVARARA